MNPDRQVEFYPGEWRPECFGHTGYGDGYLWPGRCDVRVCRSGGECYAMLRRAVEEQDPKAAEQYELYRDVLRAQQVDSNTIVVTLAAQGIVPPTQEVVLANSRQGQLDSGRWHECHEDDCAKLILKTFGDFCRSHKPPEEDDSVGGHEAGGASASPAPECAGASSEGDHGAEAVCADAGGGHDPASPTAGRFGSASDPLPPVQP